MPEIYFEESQDFYAEDMTIAERIAVIRQLHEPSKLRNVVDVFFFFLLFFLFVLLVRK